MTWRINPGALRVRTRDGDTVEADDLAAALADLAAAVAHADAINAGGVLSILGRELRDAAARVEAVEARARDVARLAAAFGVVEAAPVVVVWARRLLAELRADGVTPSTLRELEAALPSMPGAAVLAVAHREAVGDGLTAATVAELRELVARGSR